jgi:hypothetical protein
MGQRRRLALLVSLLWLACGVALASEPGRFAISQISAQPPVVTVYLDVLDENGEPPVLLRASELTASIRGEAVKVSQVTPFEASGEGVAYIFLVDVSKSIGAAQFAEIQQAIGTWIDGLKSADRMALFTFGSQYKQMVPFTSDKVRLKSVVQTLKATDPQTKFYLALNNAMNLSRQSTEGQPARRAIVILTDGKDEGSGITAEDVRDLIQQSHVPIYAIGYSRLPAQEREKYLDVLSRFATLSGGIYAPAANLGTAYQEMEGTIRRVFVLRLDCAGCRTDSQVHPLEITLASGGSARTSSMNVNLVAPAPPLPKATTQPATEIPSRDEPLVKLLLSWKVLLPLASVIGILVTLMIVQHKKSSPLPPKREGPVIVADSEASPVPGPVPVVGGKRIQLTVVAGKQRGREQNLNLAGKAVIGRDQGCDASFPDDTEMSGRHFQLALVGKYVEVLDLGSSNGTLLNGAPLVTSRRVEDGDLVRAGRTELRINIDGGT